MGVYDYTGDLLTSVYGGNGEMLSMAYDIDGTPLWGGGEILPSPTLEAYSSGYINDNGVLTQLYRNYVSDVYHEAVDMVAVMVGQNQIPNVGIIRIAEYDANKTFVQRQYLQSGTYIGFAGFELNENTRFIRVGFQVLTNINLTDLFTTYQATDHPILCSQIGYDTDKSMRATIPNKSGVGFKLANLADTVVYTGTVADGVADFSEFTGTGEYYLYCEGIRSWTFKIGANRIWNVTALPSLKFMEMSRLDAWDVGANTGYGWRDGSQFGFELNSLVMQYMSNPSYYESLPRNVYRVADTEYADLRVQDCPNIIWLMKFAIERYYDLNVNDEVDIHALVKGQIAYFLYLYPHITQYVSQSYYEQIRDWAISIWSVETSSLAWADVPINHNLFLTQSVIGGVKGACPPGYAVVPNFMMYEVCKRDGLSSTNSFLTSAENNIAWLVNNVDFKLPSNTKGQRLSEYIPFHALTYAYEMYPTHCPSGTYDKIVDIANVLISRSDNMWDYTQYQTNGDLSGATSTIWNNESVQTAGTANNPSYISMMGVYYMLERIIQNSEIKSQLKELAVAHMAHGFGRNPFNRCFDYKARDDFDGANLGWFSRMGNGAGHLADVVGVLDGSPKENAFPFNPSAGEGYSEGWVAFNTAWNMALAYLNGENQSITDGIGIFAKE